jgi:periplasmic protein CpxP/Spy
MPGRTLEKRMNITIRRNIARLGALAVCTAALCSMPMLAQGGGGGGARMTAEDQVAAIDKAVTLTPDQKPKVLAAIQDSAKKMADLRAAGGDPQEMRPKMAEIRTQQNAAIKALLTDDQKTKFDAYLASMPQQGRPGGGGGAPQQ